MKTIKSNNEHRSQKAFDTLRDVIATHYREVFNAWNPAKTQIYNFLKFIGMRLAEYLIVEPKKNLKPQLIPIQSKEKTQCIKPSHRESNGN